MTDRLIRIKEVIHTTGKSRSSIYADIALGLFPKSKLIGARSVGWSESSIQTWIQEKINPPKAKTKSQQFWLDMEKEAKLKAIAYEAEYGELIRSL